MDMMRVKAHVCETGEPVEVEIDLAAVRREWTAAGAREMLDERGISDGLRAEVEVALAKLDARRAETGSVATVVRSEAKLLADWPEDMIVTALRTSGKDLRAIRDGLDRAIRQEELFGPLMTDRAS